MRPPCSAGVPVCGYGDPSGDFHVIGDHPGIHGGATTGVPFGDGPAGAAIQEVLAAVDLLDDPDEEGPTVSNLFLSYIHPCPPASGTSPSERSYQRLERYFDAELRAVNAHILLPVGQRVTDHVLEAYTTQRYKVAPGMDDRHAVDVRGRGFLVVPIKEPRTWTSTDRDRLVDALAKILASDYRQTKGVATMVG